MELSEKLNTPKKVDMPVFVILLNTAGFSSINSSLNDNDGFLNKILRNVIEAGNPEFAEDFVETYFDFTETESKEYITYLKENYEPIKL